MKKYMYGHIEYIHNSHFNTAVYIKLLEQGHTVHIKLQQRHYWWKLYQFHTKHSNSLSSSGPIQVVYGCCMKAEDSNEKIYTLTNLNNIACSSTHQCNNPIRNCDWKKRSLQSQ